MKRLVKRIALTLVLALAPLGARAQTQHQIALTVPVAPNSINGRCYGDITNETVNGQSITLEGEAILSPFTNGCPNRIDGIEISLPPQPYMTPSNDWAYVLPPASQVTRGALVTTACGTLTTPASGNFYAAKWTFTGNCFQSVDSFNYFDTEHGATWQGTLTRQFAEYNRCTRAGCRLVDVEQSDAVNATVTVQ